ncbi:MAG: twin-arginine translocation signal domain-containing protein [Chloroflexi bacterium]|nr:MAG: twin-arginine translocation signal domain-containing protein [Chloroflexota bacterium]
MSRFDRRTFLKGAGALGLASLVTPVVPGAAASFLKGRNPLQHVIVDLQENRSFDHYYGFASFAGKAGVPPGYTQPNGSGGTVAPYHFTSLTTPDIGHNWSATHAEYDRGAMDGFYTTDGINCMGYYTAAGTSGGITTNGVWGYGVFDYPIILDLLEDAHVSWKVYNIGMDSVPFGNTDNVFFFWKRFAHDMRAHASKQDFFTDLNQGTLPNVSWIIPSFARGWDEHPPADISVGMGIVQELVDGLRNSSSWATSAYIHTYDEAGGYFDHVRPPQVDAFGLGIRVPTWVISPFAKPAHLEPTVYEHTSTLKFIEAVYSLPTLAAANHLFDSGTPSGGNYEAATGSVGPPAPPRDANPSIGNLMECFAF